MCTTDSAETTAEVLRMQHICITKGNRFFRKNMYVSAGDSQEEFWVKKVNVFWFLHAKYANHTVHNLHTAISHLHCNDKFETFK